MKNRKTTRHIFQVDFRPHETWKLLDWCRKSNSKEFTIDLMEILDVPAPDVREAESLLKEYELPSENREHLTAPNKDQIIRPTNLWQLCNESIQVLKILFPDGLFTHPSCEDNGWFEDPTFYRNGELFMGIVSHECEGLINVTYDEAVQLQELGFKTRDNAEWI